MPGLGAAIRASVRNIGHLLVAYSAPKMRQIIAPRFCKRAGESSREAGLATDATIYDKQIAFLPEFTMFFNALWGDTVAVVKKTDG